MWYHINLLYGVESLYVPVVSITCLHHSSAGSARLTFNLLCAHRISLPSAKYLKPPSVRSSPLTSPASPPHLLQDEPFYCGLLVCRVCPKTKTVAVAEHFYVSSNISPDSSTINGHQAPRRQENTAQAALPASVSDQQPPLDSSNTLQIAEPLYSEWRARRWLSNQPPRTIPPR